MTDVTANVERMRDYLANRLSDEEARDFEDRLTREPALASELELTLRLRAGLSELAERGQLASAIRNPNPSRPWWPSIAVAAVIGVLAVSLWAFHAARAPGVHALLLPSSGEERISAQFTFRALRSSDRTPVLELPASGAIELDVAPAALRVGARYTVALVQIDADGRRLEIASLPDLSPDTHGLIHCYAAASRLIPGTYALVVTLSGQPAGEAETFTFSLARAASGTAP
jgi:hypothetical protein